MTINFDIKNRFTGQVQFTAKIECEDSTNFGVKIGLAIKWAIRNQISLTGANLTGANLTGAILTGANLIGANLRDAILTDAILTGANLTGANLTDAILTDAILRGAILIGANLRDAILTGANLIGANLRDANLTGANLTDAILIGAILRDAILTGANLTGANLTGAILTDAILSEKQLRNYKHDFWGILLQYKNEIPALRQHIVEGKIDGSVYSATCACLMGTIANIRSCDVDDLQKDSRSYIESWFMAIKPGDTPENNFSSKKALEWLDEFTELLNDKEKR